MQIGKVAILTTAIVALSMKTLGVPSKGSLVNQLPTPTEDGWYELGNASFSPSEGYNSQAAAGIGYIDWPALQQAGLPADAKVRLKGGVALYNVPPGVTLDYSEATAVLALDQNVLTRLQGTFTNEVGGTICCLFCSKVTKASETAGADVTFTVNTSSTAVGCPVMNNGIWKVGKDTGVTFDQGLYGTGKVILHGFGMSASILGTLQYGGTLQESSSQNGQRIVIRSPDAISTIGKVDANNYGGSGSAAQELVYLPARGADDPPCTLVITNFASSYGGLVADPTKYRRWGIQLCAVSNNTVMVKGVYASNCYIGLVSHTTSHYKGNAIPNFDLGFGNFVIGGGTTFMNCSPTYYVSPNANVTFTGKIIEYAANLVTVNYTAESNVVNRGKLDFSATSSYPSKLAVKGYNPWNLPRQIKTRANLTTQTEVTVTDDIWTMPFDFGADDPEEVNMARCETNCKLIVPATGTVVVSNATTSASAAYPTRWTEYPVMTCVSGGEDAFAGWTVTLAGRPSFTVEKVVKDTGLYVRIHRWSGTIISIQ